MSQTLIKFCVLFLSLYIYRCTILDQGHLMSIDNHFVLFLSLHVLNFAAHFFLIISKSNANKCSNCIIVWMRALYIDKHFMLDWWRLWKFIIIYWFIRCGEHMDKDSVRYFEANSILPSDFSFKWWIEQILFMFEEV